MPKTLLRMAGNDTMLVINDTPLPSPDHLTAFAEAPSLCALMLGLFLTGIVPEVVTKLSGDEDYLVRLEPRKIVIRECGEGYDGTWASAPVVEILGDHPWKKGVDESIRALQALQEKIADSVVDPHVRTAMMVLADGLIAKGRGQ